jgi:hypothetical protein
LSIGSGFTTGVDYINSLCFLVPGSNHERQQFVPFPLRTKTQTPPFGGAVLWMTKQRKTNWPGVSITVNAFWFPRATIAPIQKFFHALRKASNSSPQKFSINQQRFKKG